MTWCSLLCLVLLFACVTSEDTKEQPKRAAQGRQPGPATEEEKLLRHTVRISRAEHIRNLPTEERREYNKKLAAMKPDERWKLELEEFEKLPQEKKDAAKAKAQELLERVRNRPSVRPGAGGAEEAAWAKQLGKRPKVPPPDITAKATGIFSGMSQEDMVKHKIGMSALRDEERSKLKAMTAEERKTWQTQRKAELEEHRNNPEGRKQKILTQALEKFNAMGKDDIAGYKKRLFPGADGEL